LIFPAPAASYTIRSFPSELILIPREDGLQVPCLLLPFRHARFLVIYFHANAEDLGCSYEFCSNIRNIFHVHVLAVEYPGYGICPGKTDEAGIIANASAAMKFVAQTLGWPSDSIKIMGRSLGTAPAIALASWCEVAGLILVAPFVGMRELFRDQVGPLAVLVDDRFPNAELAQKITSPTLIIHGQKDNLVPMAHGRQIYDATPARKMLVCPAKMGHNTPLLLNVGTLILPMTQFFSLPDYSFEDLSVPPWVYPAAGGRADGTMATAKDDALPMKPPRHAAIATTPRPRTSNLAQATDSMTTPTRFPTPRWSKADDVLQSREGGEQFEDHSDSIAVPSLAPTVQEQLKLAFSFPGCTH